MFDWTRRSVIFNGPQKCPTPQALQKFSKVLSMWTALALFYTVFDNHKKLANFDFNSDETILRSRLGGHDRSRYT